MLCDTCTHNQNCPIFDDISGLESLRYCSGYKQTHNDCTENELMYFLGYNYSKLVNRRTEPISKDDVTNITILLNTCETFDEFIERC
jgi:hypothetical protein